MVCARCSASLWTSEAPAARLLMCRHARHATPTRRAPSIPSSPQVAACVAIQGLAPHPEAREALVGAGALRPLLLLARDEFHPAQDEAAAALAQARLLEGTGRRARSGEGVKGICPGVRGFVPLVRGNVPVKLGELSLQLGGFFSLGLSCFAR